MCLDLPADFNQPADYSLASNQYDIIMEEISDFEKNLDENHEVAFKLCNFGQSITLYVTEIGYHNPDLMFYYGIANGKEMQLIQHVSQINFLLVAVPKPDPTKPARRIIGFLADS